MRFRADGYDGYLSVSSHLDGPRAGSLTARPRWAIFPEGDRSTGPSLTRRVDRSAVLLRDVRDAAGLGQVDIPLGIRRDRVPLHDGAVADAEGIEAVALVGDDPLPWPATIWLPDPEELPPMVTFRALTSITPSPVLPLIALFWTCVPVTTPVT